MRPRVLGLRAVGVRECVLWLLLILAANDLAALSRHMETRSLAGAWAALAGAGVFHYFGWFAAFRLVWTWTPPDTPARPGDIALLLLAAAAQMLPADSAIWLALTGSALYLRLAHPRMIGLTAAAAVMLALAVQSFWGGLVFQAAAVYLLRFDTALVGTALALAEPGATYTANVITMPDGFTLEVFSACASFHNISLALLVWIAVTKLARPAWRRSDLLTAAAVVLCMLLLNTARLFMLALGPARFDYWHNGTGASAFNLAASLAVVAISLCGVRHALAGRHP